MSRKSFVDLMNILRKRYPIDVFFDEFRQYMPKTLLEKALEEKEYNYRSRTMCFSSSVDKSNFYFYFEKVGDDVQVYSMTISTIYLLNPEKVEQFSPDLPERIMSFVVSKDGKENRLEISKGTKVETGKNGCKKTCMLKAGFYDKDLSTGNEIFVDLEPKTIMSY